jgi:hypothetical protein
MAAGAVGRTGGAVTGPAMTGDAFGGTGPVGGPPDGGWDSPAAFVYVAAQPARLPITAQLTPGLTGPAPPPPGLEGLPFVVVIVLSMLPPPPFGCCATTVFGGGIGACDCVPKFSSSP